MLTMRGKINISKRTFILIYLPFWFSNLVKATNATLHKDSQESKKANRSRYFCLFWGSELTVLLRVNCCPVSDTWTSELCYQRALFQGKGLEGGTKMTFWNAGPAHC